MLVNMTDAAIAPISAKDIVKSFNQVTLYLVAIFWQIKVIAMLTRIVNKWIVDLTDCTGTNTDIIPITRTDRAKSTKGVPFLLPLVRPYVPS